MNRGRRFLAAALVVGLSIPALAAQDTKDKGGADAPKAKKDDKKLPTKDKLPTAGFGPGTLGTLVKLDEDKKFTLSVTVPTIDQGKVQANQRYYLDQLNQINGLRDAAQIRQRAAQLQVEMLKRGQDIYKKTTVKVDLQAEDTVTVRSLRPLVAFDDGGNIVEYTKDDLKKLAADSPKLPGLGATFPAAYDKLQLQQQIIVYLAKTKPPAKKDTAPSDLSQPRPRVVAIVIASEVAPKN